MPDVASTPDLLRLLAVPVFGWAAWRDVRTRRVPNRTWYPLAVLGVALLLFEAATVEGYARRAFVVHVAVSLGLVVPFAYALWRIGGFGGADAKAVMVLAVLLPEYPDYYLPAEALPLESSALGVFSLTVLTNAVLAGVAYPLVLAARNAVAGNRRLAAFVGRPVPVADLPATHGRLLESPDGLSREGLDLDALRMYLRWRRLELADLGPEHRDPATLPAEPGDPTDGAVAADGGVPGTATAHDGSDATGDGAAGVGSASAGETVEDPWGAAAFLDSIDGSAYGTTPAQLREGLDLLVERDAVWVSPGIPFLVPTFAGLVVAFTYGDVFYALLAAVGAA